ncbi:helix-turn-helix domain-containing protein [Phytohabitans sp. ZYX-F-186]|uniref:Helix-turn-helix domain-containing protein n=1 Tax=Phytohabitans maris TaxID=3071409 RepID=A0ABU0ZMU6_9ACTN|nr:helix-turn-helix domain-containing protein [Phytohabitans sp. ZYX-F-186]MDQ7908368.1 helix-turn-helix domain-containing protein [Phytohabitans sp. ZYX-F-186]
MTRQRKDRMTNVFPLIPRQARGEETQTRAVYTVHEAARLLSISVSTAYALVRSGDIPAERLGRRWVIPRVRFHAWLDGATDPARQATGTEHSR